MTSNLIKPIKLQSKIMQIQEMFQIVDNWVITSQSTRLTNDKQNKQNKQGKQVKLLKKQKIINYSYKYELSKILPLPNNLLNSAIKYICLVEFPFIFQNLSKHDQVSLGIQLKDIYADQFYKGKWKNEFSYQFTIIFLVKQISNFIQQKFPSIKRNQAMESQIFIILQKVFLGMEVGSKIYSLLAKKYTIKTCINKKNHKTNPSLISKKKDSISNIQKPSSKFLSHSNFDKNRTFKRSNKIKISFSQTDSQFSNNNNPLQKFKDDLKVNLHVDPLPPIQSIKQNIDQFVSKNYQQALQFPPNMDKPKQFIYFKPNALSSSMETRINKLSSFSDDRTKHSQQKIKITRQQHRYPCFYTKSSHIQTKSQIESQKAKQIAYQCFSKGAKNTKPKIHNSQWIQIIQKLKNNSNSSYLFRKENLSLHQTIENRMKSTIIGTSKSNFQNNQDQTKYQLSSIFDSMNRSKQPIDSQKLQQKKQTEKSEKIIHPSLSDVCNIGNVEESQVHKKYTISVTCTEPISQKSQLKKNQFQSKPLKNKVKQLSKICQLKVNKTNFFKECSSREETIKC